MTLPVLSGGASLIDRLLAGDKGEYERSYADALEQAIVSCLHTAGVWTSPRRSDGVPWYRPVERTEARVRVCGRIFTIGQVEYTFWLDAERPAGDGTDGQLTLWFDADTSALAPRAARSILELIREPSDIAWNVTVPGWIVPASPAG